MHFACVLSSLLLLLILSIYFPVSVSASVLISPSLDGEFRPRKVLKGICLLSFIGNTRMCTWIVRYLKETVV